MKKNAIGEEDRNVTQLEGRTKKQKKKETKDRKKSEERGKMERRKAEEKGESKVNYDAKHDNRY